MTATKIICAWCLVILREGAEPASHGLCRDCKTRLVAEFEASESTKINFNDKENRSMSNQLKPEEIKTGMHVYWPNAVAGLCHSSFVVMALQLPLVVLGWPRTDARWIVDTEKDSLFELSEETIKAMETRKVSA